MLLGKPLAGRSHACSYRPSVEELEDRTLLSFLPPVSYGAGPFPSAVAVGDFNGDGIPDLAVTNYTQGAVAVLLGNGDGSFRSAIGYSVGNAPSDVAVGDFNGDGISDLAVTAYANPSGIVSVLLGKGDGTFQAPKNYVVGVRPNSIVVGDFAGDGRQDLAVANIDSGTVSVLLGNGDGTFQAPQDYAAGPSPDRLAVGDLDGNGDLDLVVANYVNDGTVSILLGNGDGSFQAPQSYPAGSTPYSVAVGDLNGDGVPDLAVANLYGGVSVLLGNGDGSFQAPQGYAAGTFPESVALSDFAGNGNLDLAVANNGGTVSVLLGNGDGSFQPAQNYPAGNFPVAMAAADLNGDGFPDLAVANFFGIGTVTVLLNAADWDGGASAVLSKPRSVEPIPDVLPTAADPLSLDPQHGVSEPHAIVQTTLDPTTTPVQPPLREIPGGPTSQPVVTSLPRALVLARHPPDAVFERLGDPVVDALAVSLMPEGR